MGIGLDFRFRVCYAVANLVVFLESVVDGFQGAQHAIRPFRGRPDILHVAPIASRVGVCTRRMSHTRNGEGLQRKRFRLELVVVIDVS